MVPHSRGVLAQLLDAPGLSKRLSPTLIVEHWPLPRLYELPLALPESDALHMSGLSESGQVLSSSVPTMPSGPAASWAAVTHCREKPAGAPVTMPAQTSMSSEASVAAPQLSRGVSILVAFGAAHPAVAESSKMPESASESVVLL